jgi:hypothetical protein
MSSDPFDGSRASRRRPHGTVRSTPAGSYTDWCAKVWSADCSSGARNVVVEADVVGSGPVAVRSLTVFPKTSKDPGVPRNVALIKAGLKHLAAVNRH